MYSTEDPSAEMLKLKGPAKIHYLGGLNASLAEEAAEKCPYDILPIRGIDLVELWRGADSNLRSGYYV